MQLKKLARVGMAAASFALLAAAPSAASSSTAISGAVAPTSTTFTSVRTADGNTVIEGFGTHAWSGGLSGTSTLNVHFVIHSDGQVTYEGHITFTGRTPCGTGTVRFDAQGSGPFPGPLAGTATTIDQGSSTISMHAHTQTVLFLGPAGAFGSYSGDATCG